MIPDSFKQDLLNRVDLVELIERYVPLRKGGANYLACCPFHSEKTPSFTVSPSKQFYHCFGCGAHGNAISFLMEYQGLGYIDALKDLAGSVGMKLPEWERTEPGETSGPDLYEMMERAARYYREQLKASPKAIDYLKGRGLTGKIAARFGIGYAPDGWQNLQSVFTDYDGKEVKEVGLVIESENGRRYDRFRDRIMFPILNQRGSVIGFGGRVLGAGEPKYLNSPETPLFEKGRELYGLPQARNAIRSESCVLVVEGYMDVVALAQHGVEHSVATLGTATSAVHLQKLFRATDEVVFCFDGDAAGRKAAWRALEVALPVLSDGKIVRFLFLPAEHDPDSFVREEGESAFRERIRTALPLSGYLVEELTARVSERVDIGSAEGSSRFLSDAKPLIKSVAAPALQSQLLRMLAEAVQMPVAEAARILGLKYSGYGPTTVRSAGVSPPRQGRVALPGGVHTKVLAYLLVCPKLATQLPKDLLDPERSRDGTILAVADFITEHVDGAALQKGCGPLVLDHFAAFPEHLAAIHEAQLSVEGNFSAEEAEADFGPAIAALRKDREDARWKYLEALVKEGKGSPEERREFIDLSTRARGVAERPGDAVSGL